MATTTATKRTKVFQSEVVKGVDLDVRLNALNEAEVNVIGIVPIAGDMDVYRVVGFVVKTEQVEVEVPDELIQALDQADGVAQA